MKGLDTNALVRFLIRDDEAQAGAVRGVLRTAEETGDCLFVSVAVALETMWVLSSVYECSREEIVHGIESLLILPILQVEEHERIAELCRIASKQEADLADLLIGLTSRDKGCETTLTFDKRAARSDLFTLINS